MSADNYRRETWFVVVQDRDEIENILAKWNNFDKDNRSKIIRFAPHLDEIEFEIELWAPSKKYTDYVLATFGKYGFVSDSKCSGRSQGTVQSASNGGPHALRPSSTRT